MLAVNTLLAAAVNPPELPSVKPPVPRVALSFTASVLPSAMVRVLAVAGAVIVTLFMVVADIAEAVPPPITPGAAKVAPLRLLALRLATLVVEVTTKGAVPIATVDVSCVALTARPAVRSDTATLVVTPPCTMGRTSVPARGSDAEVRALIFLSGMIVLLIIALM